jgi:S-layer family protein
MRCRNPFLGVGLALLAVMVSSPGFGQEGGVPLSQKAASEAGSPEVPEEFGIVDENLDLISFLEFLPSASVGTGYDTNLPTGTRWATGTLPFLYAPITRVPNGARVLGVDVYYYDNSSGAFEFGLCRNWRDTGTGANPGSDCLPLFASTGTPGHAYDFYDVPDFDFLRRFDVDADSTLESVDYVLLAVTPDGINTRISHARVRWKRQVSPAPSVATFTDVPVGHPQHPFVEALAAAGITAGCGGGNYCPTAPLTRGQMAVFLSVALGLHWPPF